LPVIIDIFFNFTASKGGFIRTGENLNSIVLWKVVLHKIRLKPRLSKPKPIQDAKNFN